MCGVFQGQSNIYYLQTDADIHFAIFVVSAFQYIINSLQY